MEPQTVPLKGPTHTYSDSLALSSSTAAAAPKVTDIWGETELSRIRMRGEGAAFCYTTVLAKAIVSFLSPPKSQQAGARSESPSLAHAVHHSLVTP